MEEIKLRKYEHALVVSGVGVIAFGLWSIVKATIYFILIPLDQLTRTQMAEGMSELQSMGITDRALGYLIAAAILFAMLIDFSLRLYIGRAAVIDGRRLGKKRFVYVILAMFVAAGLVLSLLSRVLQLAAGEDSLWTEAIAQANVSTIVDLTSLMALIEMVIAAFMVRRLRRELGIGEMEDE